MQFTIQTIIALCLSGLAIGSPTPATEKAIPGSAIVADPSGEMSIQNIWSYSFTCETSDGSPFVSEAQAAADYLASLPAYQRCVQTSSPDYPCTRMIAIGSGKFEICGPTGNWGYCREFGWQLKEFAKASQCARGSRVGGQIKVNGDGANSGLNLRWLRN